MSKLQVLKPIFFILFTPILQITYSQTITNKERVQNAIQIILASAPKVSQINNSNYPLRSKQLLLDLRNTLQTISESLSQAKTKYEVLKGLFVKLNSLSKSVGADVVIMQKDIGGTPQEQEQWKKCTEFFDACLKYKCGGGLGDPVNLECFYGCQAEAITCEKSAIVTAFSNVTGQTSGTATQKQ